FDTLLRALAAAALAAASVLATLNTQGFEGAVLAGLCGGMAIALAGRPPVRPIPVLRDALVLGVLAWAARGGIEAWQAPASWAEVFDLTVIGGAIATGLYLVLAMRAAAWKGRPLSHRAALFVLGAPFLFRI